MNRIDFEDNSGRTLGPNLAMDSKAFSRSSDSLGAESGKLSGARSASMRHHSLSAGPVLRSALSLVLQSSGQLHEAVVAAAHENPIDPFVDEYLRRLPSWDGTTRLDTWLTRLFGGEQTLYTRAISRKFVLSIIARTLEPGCKVDTKLVLVGPQGIGKSSALRELVGSRFFGDTPASPQESDKDRLARLHRCVLFEDQEMDAYSAADVKHDKAVLSTRSDVFRPPYGRNTKEYARRFVLCGTTNEMDGFLRDATGGRRYWPFVCEHAADLAWLRANRDQIWAEAWASAMLELPPWWLTAEEEAEAAIVQHEHRDRDPLESALAEALDRPIGQQLQLGADPMQGPVHASQIAGGRLIAITSQQAWSLLNPSRPLGDCKKADGDRFARMLRSLGWTRGAQQRLGGERVRLFRRPEAS